MIGLNRFALNRIAAPKLPLAEFYRLAASVGFTKVELRNDLGGLDPIDGMKPAEAAALAAAQGLELLTINALQKFNLASARPKASADLEALLALAKALGCKALVLCPNNDAGDARSPAERAAETVDALAAFGPAFEAAGVEGYIEPLGFSISSLASLVQAHKAIVKSGFGCYKLLLDSFHHHIGPENLGIFRGALGVAAIGLVHLSGVEQDLPLDAYRDEHRILTGPGDRMKSKEQILRLEELGYSGSYSFEPFSPELQNLPKAELAAALRGSLEYLRS